MTTDKCQSYFNVSPFCSKSRELLNIAKYSWKSIALSGRISFISIARKASRQARLDPHDITRSIINMLTQIVIPLPNKPCSQLLLLSLGLFISSGHGALSSTSAAPTAERSGTRDCPCKDAHLCQLVQKTARKEVYGFAVKNDSATYLKYDWSKLTTVNIYLAFPPTSSP